MSRNKKTHKSSLYMICLLLSSQMHDFELPQDTTDFTELQNFLVSCVCIDRRTSNIFLVLYVYIASELLRENKQIPRENVQTSAAFYSWAFLQGDFPGFSWF